MDFQVGDEVVCLLNGAGKVISVDVGNYPINVRFLTGIDITYTKTGYLYADNEFPCLFHKGTEVNIKPAKPKRYPWVNIYVMEDGTYYVEEGFSNKKHALNNCYCNNLWKYVDTIQLKPKED